MARIQGVTIQILEPVQTGTDALGRPVYTETPEDVADVLVGEPSTAGIPEGTDLAGKKAVYCLAIPKGDTHVWTDKKVVLPAPFAGTYKTFGFPVAGIEANVPLRWNTKVLVEKYE